jgi:hypothetical protein
MENPGRSQPIPTIVTGSTKHKKAPPVGRQSQGQLGGGLASSLHQGVGRQLSLRAALQLPGGLTCKQGEVVTVDGDALHGLKRCGTRHDFALPEG